MNLKELQEQTSNATDMLSKMQSHAEKNPSLEALTSLLAALQYRMAAEVALQLGIANEREQRWEEKALEKEAATQALRDRRASTYKAAFTAAPIKIDNQAPEAKPIPEYPETIFLHDGALEYTCVTAPAYGEGSVFSTPHLAGWQTWNVTRVGEQDRYVFRRKAPVVQSS